MLEKIGVLLEIYSCLIILHNMLNARFKACGKATALIVAFEILLVEAINLKYIPAYCIFLGYIIMITITYFETKQSGMRVIFCCIVSMLIVGITQILSAWITIWMEESSEKIFLVNLCTFLLINILCHFTRLSYFVDFIFKGGKSILYVVGMVFSCFMIVMFVFKYSKELSIFEYILLLMMVFVAGIMFRIWKKEREYSLQEEKMIRMQSFYDSAFQKLIKEIRERQHEFNNQINSLYSMHYTCDTYEELVAKQEEYAGQLMDKNKYNSLIGKTTIYPLIGMLYFKAEKAEKEEIMLELDVSLDTLRLEDEDWQFAMDIIDVTSVLVDNAMEAVKEKTTRKVRLSMYYSLMDKQLCIEVANISRFFKNEEITNFFKSEYSSKGEGRGIGLNIIKKVKKKYAGTLLVENQEVEGENWLVFQLKLQWK